MRHVLAIIDGKPLLSGLEEDSDVLSEKGYESVKSINEVIVVDDDEWADESWFYTQGHHAHQVLEYSIKTLIDHENPALVQKIVKLFGIKNFFADAFSDMIDNLGK